MDRFAHGGLDEPPRARQDKAMGRPLRTTAGGLIYHVLNRANRRATLFEGADEYAAFLRTLAEAQREHPMRLLAYCVMPNHWHLVVWPERDRELSRFVGWLTLTHTQRRHAARGTAGSGHLYQGRFKSFPVEADDHLLVVCRYVERNAVRAGLVARAADWPWGSLYQRGHGPAAGRPALAESPVPWPPAWAAWVDTPQTAAEEAALRRCVRRGRPFGGSGWVEQTVTAFRLGSTLRRPGRPRKPPNSAQRLLFDETVPDTNGTSLGRKCLHPSALGSKSRPMRLATSHVAQAGEVSFLGRRALGAPAPRSRRPRNVKPAKHLRLKEVPFVPDT